MCMTSLRSLLHASVAVVLVCVVSCSNNEPPPAQNGSGDVQVSITRTDDGASVSQRYTTSATISEIDRSTRTVTVETPDGRKTAFVAGNEVRNFDQLAVGDRITADIWQVLDVHLVRNEKATTEPAMAAMTVRAPKGAKPGGFTVTTLDQYATVIALDKQTRQATLQFPDGKWWSLQVGKNVDLTDVKVGDRVRVTLSEGAAISVAGK